MYRINSILFVISFLFVCSNTYCQADQTESLSFPEALVHFVPFKKNPVFAGTDTTTWDRKIRERGYMLHEDGVYKLWYTGYENEKAERHLGYATSPNGFTWTRYKDNPVHTSHWVEDMCVIKVDNTYYMFAEGKNDVAHMMTSADGIQWKEKGDLDIRLVNGASIAKGAFGTPAIFKENNTWYLFYERADLGVWLATSTDLKVWKNVQDEPVLALGPDAYDKYAVAMNQVIKYNGLYYGYYHASDTKGWKAWTTNVAVSKDLIHWKKYEGNPIIRNDNSSGILVNDGTQYRLYTMHPSVNVYMPVTTGKK